MTGGKSGSHPDYSNKHTRTLINWICLSAFYTNDLFLSTFRWEDTLWGLYHHVTKPPLPVRPGHIDCNWLPKDDIEDSCVYWLSKNQNSLLHDVHPEYFQSWFVCWYVFLHIYICNVKLKLSLRIMNYLWRLLFFFFFHCDKHFQLFRFFVGSFRRMSIWRCHLRWLRWGDAKEIFGHTLNIEV